MDISNLQNSNASRLLASLKSYYNIHLFEDEPYLCARCDYFEKAEKFMVSRKANLWSANSEEFLYLFYVENLTSSVVDECLQYVHSSWEKEATIDRNHMYTYVTPIFICETADEDSVKKIRKCRIYKSYKFSFWGWMEYHTALVCSNGKNRKIYTNGRGRCVKKMLDKVLV